MESINISLICSHSIVREGLKSILLEEQFLIAGQHKDCRALIAAKDNGITDVGMIVVDAGNSPDVARDVASVRLAFPDSFVVTLHEDLEVERLVNIFDAGASGYILKEISCESLINCLHLAAQGEKVVPGELVNQLPHLTLATADQVKAEGELSELLSKREISTLRCLVMGYPNKVIARRLEIGEATVKVHVKAILRKLNVQNRTQAAICAVNHGIQAAVPDVNEPGPGPNADELPKPADVCEGDGASTFMLVDRRVPERAIGD